MDWALESVLRPNVLKAPDFEANGANLELCCNIKCNSGVHVHNDVGFY